MRRKNYFKQEYPPNWSEVRGRIAIRAENRCEHCQIANKTLKYNGKIVTLGVAHLDKEHWHHDIADDRLAFLCENCHSKYDATRRVDSRKYGRLHKKYDLKFW